MKKKLPLSENGWSDILSEEEFSVLRKKSTEKPFSGKYLNNKKKGKYACAGCGNPLFSSESKFDSGTLWPSFFKPISKENVETKRNSSIFMERTEALCKNYGGHLGHVFNDGPKPAGLRFCINSIALKFSESKKQKK